MKFQYLEGKYYVDGKETPKTSYFRKKKEFQKKMELAQKVPKLKQSNRNNTRLLTLEEQKEILRYKSLIRYYTLYELA
jgi:hypothetical protein